jgi:predicted nucleic-acid-binding Zn-ribbon protein
MNRREKLKPCPKCGNTGELVGMMGTGVMCLQCGFIGPYNDPTGSKWNALSTDSEEYADPAEPGIDADPGL